MRERERFLSSLRLRLSGATGEGGEREEGGGGRERLSILRRPMYTGEKRGRRRRRRRRLDSRGRKNLHTLPRTSN